MRAALTFVTLAALAASAGCAATKSNAADGAGGSEGGVGVDGPAEHPLLVLPQIPESGYTMLPGDVGGYLLGAPIAAADFQPLPPEGSSMCNRLRGVVRDFKGALPAYGGALEEGGHPDFEVFQGESPTKGLVAADIDDPVQRKPRYASRCELGAAVDPNVCPYGAMTTSLANFKQWYTSIEGVNKTYFVYFQLVYQPDSRVWTFASKQFFPLGAMDGWGASGVDGMDMHTPRNYSFTTEIHATFRYNGGETFRFNGDDDVWIFINGKLAVDLGGLHKDVQGDDGAVNLDEKAASLGIQKGTVYVLDLFHAERHSVNSNFRIDLNFAFEDCGYIVP